LIHLPFEQAAGSDPDLVAVEHGDLSVTYGELNRKAEGVAAALIDRGVKPGDFVGIVTTRSIEMVVAIYGVLKSGAAYVPVDSTLPLERINYILQTAQCNISLVHPSTPESVAGKLATATNMSIDSQLMAYPPKASPPTVDGNSPAFVVFTSGSTGQPKGVTIKHMSLANFIMQPSDILEVKKGTRVGQICTITFDVCACEIFSALSYKGTLVLRTEDIIGTLQKCEKIMTPPSLLSSLAPSEFPNLKVVVSVGEPCPQHIVNTWGSALKLKNGYGPSEITIISSSTVLQPGKQITVGKPEYNTVQYIVDKDMCLVPQGVAGELVIGGMGVSLGYLNRSDLTAERFIHNHFLNDGSTMYRTGDICRWTEEGEIQIIGRIDDMVKVKGYRIELDEVSAAINKHAEVHASVVLVRNNMLVGYVTPATINIDKLREFVLDILPHYMVPTVFVPVEEFKVNNNGKIDKKHLLAMEITQEFEAPETEKEIQLANIWAKVLNVNMEHIGKHTTFFELGGDSISAIQLLTFARDVGIILTVASIFKKPTLSLMAKSTLDDSHSIDLNVTASDDIYEEVEFKYCIDHDDIEDIYPVTPLQAGLISSSIQDASTYVFQLKWVLDFEVDIAKLESAFDTITSAFDIFRTRFVVTSAGIYQVLQKNAKTEIHPILDMEEYCSWDLRRGFTVDDQSWFRVGLGQAENGKHYFVWTMHHVLYDGWCLDRILSSLFAAYNGNHIAQSVPFKRAIQYIKSRDEKETDAFWSSYLQDVPRDEGFHQKITVEGGIDPPFEFKSSASLLDINKATALTQNTLATVVKAAWGLTLKMYQQKEIVIFGSVLSGRELPIPGVENIVGMMINTLPVVIRCSGGTTLKTFLQDIQKDYIDCLAFSHANLSQVQKLGGVESGQQLFTSSVVIENLPEDHQEDLPAIQEYQMDSDLLMNFNEYDIQLTVVPEGKHLQLSVEYNNSKVGKKFVERFSNYFDNMLNSIVNKILEKKDVLVSELSHLTPNEMERLMTVGKGPIYSPPNEICHQSFDKRAKQTPNATAVVHGNVSITYSELQEKAAAIASQLQKNGVKKGDVVGLLTIRSIEMVVGMIGILKTGAAFIPIDSELPLERINHIIQSSKCRLILYHSNAASLLPNFNGIHLVALDSSKVADNPCHEVSISGEDAAYVIFTSGSTGKPKGVVVSHRSISNLCNAEWFYPIKEGTKVGQLASIGFDVCVSDVFRTLSNGATLVLRDAEDYFAIIKDVDVIEISPAALLKMNPDDYPNLKVVVVGGEQCPITVRDTWANRVTLVNSYGPTEGTVTTSESILKVDQNINIGRPIPNSVQYIVNEKMELVPYGIQGELIIGGICVALGYLNRPDLTAEKFVHDHFMNDGSMMYRTGDICRWNDDGMLEISGRMDDMVKIKSFRIELNEVAMAVDRHPDVKGAMVLVKNDMLVAYATPKEVVVDSVLDFVSDILPHYMIPSEVVTLDVFPMNANGKIDKTALLAIEISHNAYLPTTDTEIELAQLWSSILNIDSALINSSSSYFSMGGDSINVHVLVKEIQDKLKVSVTPKDVYKYQSLARISRFIDEKLNNLETKPKGLVHQISQDSIDLDPIDDLLHSSRLAFRAEFSARPLRIVCFHGQATSASIMQNQLEQVKAALGSKTEMYFIQAEKEVSHGAGELKKYYDSKWYEWWSGSLIRKSQVSKTLNSVVEKLNELGQVDALLGFSQGASLIELLDRKAEAKEIVKTWKFSVLLSGTPIKSITLPSKLNKGVQGGIPSSSIIVNGVKELARLNRGLVDRYNVNYREIVEHSGGHEIPQNLEFTRRLADKIIRMAMNERKRNLELRQSVDEQMTVSATVFH
ncbi:hypothetical protein HDV06_004347, partial [Boothiomyces sp. JEL0866]